MSEATIEIELEPFRVPNFVLVKSKVGLRQDGFVETPKYRLSDLPIETLERMCDDFRRSVLEKARQV